MNDYAFGNHLYALRKKAGLSQTQLAARIGVTNKAVSKWENGRAKPPLPVLKTLACLYDLSLDELFALKEKTEGARVVRIVITGGPCAGKSTAMSRIQETFSGLGWTVLFIAETATELISAGVSPSACSSNLSYQTLQMKLQIEKEKIFEQAAQALGSSKVRIVCDRGLLDNKAYMNDSEFCSLIHEMETDEVTLRDSYDAVFHLVTAAKGAREFYTLANNAARTETPEEAARLDDRLISVWSGHPHLRIIDNTGDFEQKLHRLICEIAVVLGEPEPLEIERKFLIEYPDLNWLNSMSACKKVEIIQTYLQSPPDQEIRIRQRGADGHYAYFRTCKKQVSPATRIEQEERLSEHEYLRLLMQADPTRKAIRKDRYCLVYENQYFEIDVPPFWKNQAIMEIELHDKNQRICFPKQIRILKEVTDDPAYRNLTLAQTAQESSCS